jgi:ubiquinone/menaquinone biosynthesis C-methylase UbiE
VGLAQWSPNGRIVGIDLGGEQLEGARTLARARGLSNVAFQQGDIFALPFDEESFDLVLMRQKIC